jgi:hypothetical protein
MEKEMNLRKLLSKLSLIVVLLTVFAANTSAQTYVSNTNGNDVTGNGLDVGVGIPWQTIAKGIENTLDGGTIIIDADTYNESGPIKLTIGTGATDKNLTFVARKFNGLLTATIANGITIDAAKTININLGAANENFKTGIVNLTDGALNITSSSLVISSGGFITRAKGTLNTNPTTTNVNVIYSSTTNITAGGELPPSLGTGTLTVGITAKKTLTVPYSLFFTDAGNIIVNSGNVNFVGANFTFATAFAADPIKVINAGDNVTFSGDVNFSSSATVGAGSIELLNNSTGTLTFGGMINNNADSKSPITIALTNNATATGTISLAGGSVNGVVTNTAGKTLVLTGAATFSGTPINNAGTLQINNGNTLTLSGNTALSNTGNIISAKASTVGTGYLSISKVVTLTGGGELPNVNIIGTGGLVIPTGTTVPVYGALTLSSSAANALDFVVAGVPGTGTGVLEIWGSTFNRTDNTPNNVRAGLGTLSFRGALTQVFNPGASLALFDLIVDKTGSNVVSLGASVFVSDNLNVKSGTLDVGNFNLNMTGAGTVTNNGLAYSSSALGYIGFLGKGGTITGTGTFGNILVSLSAVPNTVNTLGDINFSGILFINKGTFNVPAGTMTFTDDLTKLNPSSPNPTVKINTNAFNMSAFTFAGANSVTYKVFVNLDYVGSDDFTVGAEWLGTPTKLNNVTIEVADAKKVTATTAATINGTLTVNNGTTLAQGGVVYTLAGDGKTHSIVGSVTGGTLLITGNGSYLNGTTGATTVTDYLATVNNLDFEPAANNASFYSNNLKIIGGALTLVGTSAKTGSSATIVMNPKESTLTGALAVGAGAATTASVTVNGSATSVFTSGVTVTAGNLTLTRGGKSNVIGGGVTLTGGNLTLGSDISVTGTTLQGLVAADAGSINAGGFKYIQSGAVSNYTRAGSGTFTNGTLSLDATSGAITLTPGTKFTVPNLEAVGTVNGVSVTASMEVLNSFLLDNAGTFTQTDTLTVSGNTITINKTATAGAFTGAMELKGTAATLTLGQDYDIPTLIINATSGTVTLATNDLKSPKFRTLTVDGTYRNNAGTFATGNNNLTITGAFIFTADAITQGDGILTWNGKGAPPYKPTLPASGFSIKNLTILSPTDVGKSAFTVIGKLVLSNTLTTSADGKLTLSDSCWVTRTGNAFKLSNVPNIPGAINLDYNTFTGPADILTDKEMPASVNNLTVEKNAKGVVLTADVTVTGTLSLASYLNAKPNKNTITMADGSSLELQVNGDVALDQNLTKGPLGTMKLIYNGAKLTTQRELSPAVKGAYPVYTGDVTIQSDIAQDNITTWNGTFTFDGGNYDLNSIATNIGGSVATTKKGNFTNAIEGAKPASLNFTGAKDTKLQLISTWQVPASINFSLNTASNTNQVVLSGGDLDFALNKAELFFINGILVTSPAPNETNVILNQTAFAGVPVQGFDRQGVTGKNISHISGTVKKKLDVTVRTDGGIGSTIALTRVEFPVGSLPVASTPATPAVPAYYKPLALQFTAIPTANTVITVSEVESNPGGTNGFPIVDPSLPDSLKTKKLANYPNFYWMIKSDLSLQAQVIYDIEAEANGYGPSNYPEGIQNVRLLRRLAPVATTSNPWVLQGGLLGYDNSTNVDHAKIIVKNAIGAISTQGALFTYSQIAKSPTLTTPLALVSGTEGQLLTVKWTATTKNLNDGIVFSPSVVWVATSPAVNPTNATFANGTLTWTPSVGQAGNYQLTVTAKDLKDTTLTNTNTVIITIAPSNGAAIFDSSTPTKASIAVLIKGTQTPLTITYLAKAPHVSDVVKYSVVSSPVPSGKLVIDSLSGALTYTPSQDTVDVHNSPYTFTIHAKSGSPVNDATAKTVVTVTYNTPLHSGDVDASGGAADPQDASLILQYVVKLLKPTFTPLQLLVADVNNDHQVGALDAAWILYMSQNNGKPPLNKTVAPAGNAQFGQLIADNGVMRLPISLQNTRGVVSVYSEVNLGLNVDYKSIKTNLPDGWQVASNIENGMLKIAMAGLTPLTDGNLAVIEISLKDKESKVNIQGSVTLNDADALSMKAAELREIPTEFNLSQNYPNPFNPTTNINYAIPQDANVRLVIFNVLGQAVKTLVNSQQKAGYYTIRWDGSNESGSKVSSGMYIYRITAGNFTHTIKMNLIK